MRFSVGTLSRCMAWHEAIVKREAAYEDVHVAISFSSIEGGKATSARTLMGVQLRGTHTTD